MGLTIPRILFLFFAATLVLSSAMLDQNKDRTCRSQLSPSIEVPKVERGSVRLGYNGRVVIGKREEFASHVTHGANKHIFGSNLPADKTGWVENGYAFFLWRTIPYVSTDPNTGKERKHLGMCQPQKPKIPDDAECCRNDIFLAWCRTYKKSGKRDSAALSLSTMQSTTPL